MELIKRIAEQRLESPAQGRVMRFVASDESLDRYNSVIKVDGWDLVNFRKNPVFLWSHEAWIPPVGRVIQIGAETITRAGKNEPALVASVEFSDTPEGEKILKLYRSGALSAVSVGFRPTASRKPTEDETKRGWPSDALIYTAQELYELSGVSVPGNQNALKLELSLENATEELVTRALGFEKREVEHSDPLTETQIKTLIDASEARIVKAIVDALKASTDQAKRVEAQLARLTPVVKQTRSYVEDLDYTEAKKQAAEILAAFKK